MRCDGLVVATPAGSTGYNLANGGPVMAWGVEGFVVSFIAPHSLTARALVVAPGDRLTIHNRSREPLDVAVDGRPAGEIAAGRSDRRALRRRRSARSRSCPARPSTAACARSSAAWRADRRSAVRAPLEATPAARRRGRSAERRRGLLSACTAGPVALHRGDELVELVAREAPLAAGRAVAADVAGVGPAADRRQRDAEVAGRLRAREDELAARCGAGKGGACGRGRSLVRPVVWRVAGPGSAAGCAHARRSALVDVRRNAPAGSSDRRSVCGRLARADLRRRCRRAPVAPASVMQAILHRPTQTGHFRPISVLSCANLLKGSGCPVDGDRRVPPRKQARGPQAKEIYRGLAQISC